MTIRSAAELSKLNESFRDRLLPKKPRVLVGVATCGVATGSRKVLDAMREVVSSRGLDVELIGTGCKGACFLEPLVDAVMPGRGRITYFQVKPEDATPILDETLRGGVYTKRVLGRTLSEQFLIDGTGCDYCPGELPDEIRKVPAYPEIPFFGRQMHVAMRNCGYIDPASIEDYIGKGGYSAAAKALTQMEPEEIIEIIKASGLRGRGGGGFPTGRKWESCRKAHGDERYVICNADEGDPGAYMDRSIIEGDPHSVIEGMIIGSYAIGANQGFIYVREEYPLAVERLRLALKQAEEWGFLGRDILGSGHDFTIQINRGAGAFVCGESTALMASLEGRVGEPRAKYIHTVESGLWNRPSCLNNVETWNNVPVVIARGAEWFSSIGTEASKGTKVFSLVGKVKNVGLVEVPMGLTLRQVIEEIGGGVPDGGTFKAVQTGGPSGGCIPAQYLDEPVDFDRLTELGSMMGSGGMIVMDDRTCMVDVARYFLAFLKDESCGKCVPCREGTARMLEILENICEGRGREGDIELLRELAEAVADGSLCALGTSAPNPVLTTLNYFADEYKAHILDRECPARVCRALISYCIDGGKCSGCTACVKACPTGAVSGEAKKPHAIDQGKCIKCGLCRDACRFDAVEVW